MQFTITEVDYAPEDLHEQLPLVANLLRMIPGKDRPDYWLASVQTPIKWLVSNQLHEISHIVLAARWAGTRIENGAANLPVGIGFVVDDSLLTDSQLDLAKCTYVAIGTGSDTTDGIAPPRLTEIRTGYIARGFGTGGP